MDHWPHSSVTAKNEMIIASAFVQAPPSMFPLAGNLDFFPGSNDLEGQT